MNREDDEMKKFRRAMNRAARIAVTEVGLSHTDFMNEANDFYGIAKNLWIDKDKDKRVSNLQSR